MQRLIPSVTGAAFVAGDRPLPDFAREIGDETAPGRPTDKLADDLLRGDSEAELGYPVAGARQYLARMHPRDGSNDR